MRTSKTASEVILKEAEGQRSIGDCKFVSRFCFLKAQRDLQAFIGWIEAAEHTRFSHQS